MESSKANKGNIKCHFWAIEKVSWCLEERTDILLSSHTKVVLLNELARTKRHTLVHVGYLKYF